MDKTLWFIYNGSSFEKSLFLLTLYIRTRDILRVTLLNHKFKTYKRFICSWSLDHFQRLSYVCVREHHGPIFSQQGYNIRIVDRYYVVGGVRYRDSKCNIGTP